MKNNPSYAQVAYDFVNLTPVKFIAFGRNVAAMTADAVPVYADPIPALPVLTAQLDALETATQLAINGDRVAIAARNAEFDAAEVLLRQLGAFVQVKCNGDKAVLLTSGYLVRNLGGGRVGQLPAPLSVSLTSNGNSGEVAVKWPRIPNAATNTVYVSLTAEGPFLPQGTCTASRFTLTDLTPLKPIYVKVCGNGAAGEGVLSSVMTIVVM